jgi:hypothetical protein
MARVSTNDRVGILLMLLLAALFGALGVAEVIIGRGRLRDVAQGRIPSSRWSSILGTPHEHPRYQLMRGAGILVFVLLGVAALVIVLVTG